MASIHIPSNAVKTILSAAKRADHVIRHGAAWCQMRALEKSLQGKLDTIPYVSDEPTLAAMHASIQQLQIDLAAARSHYSSFLPAGQRVVWEVA